MKKKIAIMLIAVFVLSLSVFGIASQDKAYAKTVEMHIEVPDSIKKENEFKVTIVLESDVQLYSIDAYLSYDSEVLEFIPNSEYVTGAEGVLELKDVYEEETMSATYEITFKAIETGTADIALTNVYLIDYADLEYLTVTPSSKQFEIGVNNRITDDARLSELIVAPGELNQEFDPNQLTYEMHVGLEVETIGISAIPMNEESVVGLDMPEKLQIGQNVIKVTVTALSGNVNEYVIVVYREDKQETTAEMLMENDTSTESETSVEVEVTEESTTVDNTSETTENVTTEASTQEETAKDTSLSEIDANVVEQGTEVE